MYCDASVQEEFRGQRSGPRSPQNLSNSIPSPRLPLSPCLTLLLIFDVVLVGDVIRGCGAEPSVSTNGILGQLPFYKEILIKRGAEPHSLNLLLLLNSGTFSLETSVSVIFLKVSEALDVVSWSSHVTFFKTFFNSLNFSLVSNICLFNFELL